MKKIYKYIFIALCGLVFSACPQVEEQYAEEQYAEELDYLKFIASTEGEASTKTTMIGELGEETHSVLWCPEDQISIVPEVMTGGCYKEYLLKNTSTEEAQTAVFEGQAVTADSYFAAYPPGLINVSTFDTASVEICLPDTLVYQEGTFAHNSFPMAAIVESGDDISFNNLCGILAIKLTGTETIKSLTFVTTGDQKVAGTFSLDIKDGNWEMCQTDKSLNSIIMDCGDEGVTLKETEPTVFYFILPSQIYETFTLQIVTTDGKMMFKNATKPLEIKRSVLTPAGTLAYMESEAFDLSERGTANCYIVTNPGKYSFDATVIGNGDEGFVVGAEFHTSDPNITPSLVEVLWETNGSCVKTEKEEIIANVTLTEDGYVNFFATGVEGNALVAVMDADSTILWNWHIWFTDQPKDQHYVNDSGEFDVLDRNLGATRADRGVGDEWKESCGLDFQWGRKDPLSAYNFTESDQITTIAQSIMSPNIKATSWDFGPSESLWSTTQKTIYDPCPPRYRTAPRNVWKDFSIQETSSSFDHGWNFIYDGTNTAWYPVRADHMESGINYWSDSYMAVADRNTGVYFSSTNFSNTRVRVGQTRCMKDGNYVDPLSAVSKVEEISDITGTSATIKSVITYVGKGEIISRGIVYDTSPGFSVDAATKIEAADETLEFTIDLFGLETAKKYYVRAYAVNSDGISYSDEVSFHTLYVGDGIDLSKDGTANCYIVPPVYSAYTFDYTVKGNSLEPVGDVVSVEVLWETKNTIEIIEKGDIISEVELLDGKVRFMLPGDPVPGNALIAVKDASDNILWSWHIWVVDFDPFASAQIYPSGAMMMDRNLGALVSDINDVRSFGFFYQWGRKDPFAGSGDGIKYGEFAYTTGEIKNVAKDDNTNTLAYSILHPDTIITKSDWNKDKTYWTSSKTAYDPCPIGWRTADKYVWEELNAYVSYPKTGILHSDGELYAVTSLKHVWSSTFVTSYTVGYYGGTTGSIYDGYAVRCMKDADFVSETVSVSDVTEEGATLTGKLTINDNTVIEEMGFVLSTADGYITIVDETNVKLIVSNTTGTYSVVATGLNPNTIYYIRAYAKGGYNDKYGEIMEFRTHSVGISDDFTDDGYDWE